MVASVKHGVLHIVSPDCLEFLHDDAQALAALYLDKALDVFQYKDARALGLQVINDVEKHLGALGASTEPQR